MVVSLGVPISRVFTAVDVPVIVNTTNDIS